jgi:predicted ester cyclase
MTDPRKAVVLAYVEAFNRGDVPALRALFTPDGEVHGVLGWGRVDAVASIWGELHAAFGIELDVQALVAEGDIVAARYVERGRSRASFRGGPVTGRSYEIVAMEWFEFAGALIRRRWGARDMAAQHRQMGLPLG